ncbi:hypothetical protein BKA70DRAFT_1399115 [Coprinopsis sp. MPI-PUGE-AT-0042]|nr:hypothetical protein BKA70DRAFT_1399115 [Coprinopsis sp. MPI-PUGE-AT-0042]
MLRSSWRDTKLMKWFTPYIRASMQEERRRIKDLAYKSRAQPKAQWYEHHRQLSSSMRTGASMRVWYWEEWEWLREERIDSNIVCPRDRAAWLGTYRRRRGLSLPNSIVEDRWDGGGCDVQLGQRNEERGEGGQAVKELPQVPLITPHGCLLTRCNGRDWAMTELVRDLSMHGWCANVVVALLTNAARVSLAGQGVVGLGRPRWVDTKRAGRGER